MNICTGGVSIRRLWPGVFRYFSAKTASAVRSPSVPRDRGVWHLSAFKHGSAYYPVYYITIQWYLQV